MHFNTLVTGRRRLVGGHVLGATALGSSGLVATATHTTATRAAATRAAAPTWVSTQGKTVHLTLIAAWNNRNAGFNFDGAANGRMIVTVPLGAKIVATYQNDATTPHDVRIIVRIIKYQKPLPAHTVTLAFAGASAGGGSFGGPGAGGPPRGTPGPGGPGGPGGPPQSSRQPQTFSFVANKAGTYMIMCGFPGYALAGMWATFVVSKTARTASVRFT